MAKIPKSNINYNWKIYAPHNNQSDSSTGVSAPNPFMEKQFKEEESLYNADMAYLQIKSVIKRYRKKIKNLPLLGRLNYFRKALQNHFVYSGVGSEMVNTLLLEMSKVNPSGPQNPLANLGLFDKILLHLTNAVTDDFST